ncbi:MAG: HTTM domain-containing protein [Bacteroidota bacterium]
MNKSSSSAFGISGLDIRSIALFRILVGFNVIYNILQYRLFNISAFYSEQGIVPKSVIETNYGAPFSLLSYINSEALVAVYFVICLLLAVLYTLGIKSRWIGIALFILFGSIINANPVISHGVEFLIEISLFWGLFLPLDACFSLLPDRSTPQKAQIKGLVTYGILFQIALVYLTSFLTKTGDLWQSGMVIYSITDDRTHAVLLADWLSDKPGLCSFLTYFALIIELSLPFLIFSPFYNRFCRLLSAISIVGLHVGLALVLFVGPFHLVTLVFAAVLLPTFVWKKFNIGADTNFPLSFLQNKAAKEVTTKGRKAKKKQDKTSYPIGDYAWKTIMIVMMLVIFQKNLQKWKEESYLSSVLSNMGPISELADMNPTKATPFTGLLQQPWWLFAPNPHKDMGTIVLLGRTDTNETLDLLGDRILTIESDPMTQEPKFDKKIVNHFSSSRFVLSFYARRYINNFPPELFQRWTNFEYQRWRKDHPNQKLLELRMYYYSNSTKLERGKIVRKKDLALMHTMPIVE